MLRRPRFGPDCTLGRRLAEDIGLLSDLAPTSGLQEELFEHSGSNSSAKPMSSLVEAADLTLALIGLISQKWPRIVRSAQDTKTLRRLKHSLLFQQDCLNVDASTTILRELFRALEIAGIFIHYELEERSESEWLQLRHR